MKFENWKPITQGRIVVRDGGSPARSATALAFITVIRNLFRPTFQPQNYEETTLETRAIGTSVARVFATDQDSRVSVEFGLVNIIMQQNKGAKIYV